MKWNRVCRNGRSVCMYTILIIIIIYWYKYTVTLNNIDFSYVLNCHFKIEMSKQSCGPSTPPASQVQKVSHSGRASRPEWLSRSSSSGPRPAARCRPRWCSSDPAEDDNMRQPTGQKGPITSKRSEIWVPYRINCRIGQEVLSTGWRQGLPFHWCEKYMKCNVL